ncbi:hypothetical protein TTHERM_00313540 (macronuclear) [Tetrahymena thermophila SB210]|uniref:Uncharacterized protein n=1 Tax=Tetrahymena thermophila (strain SB210) TaxID=312017 RepID=Q22KC7_TETTS|nr:hypothetical protein TTHERM_00313540 [Tetrahymena thermophila SB210]EAR85872.2 hypothetical protein TTHERM_00313540 [Tetrahymena thermophila SB210]|eukprot:XP_001033535.2 hypothetical protein TTHERM_00313540 [Tetrahymena thermophila SB210]
MEKSDTPLEIKKKQLVINLQTPQSKSQVNLVSPHGSELSHNSQAFYSKPSAFITSKDINQAISDLSKNIKEGKYHRAILRMHKLLSPNSSLSFAPYQQIKLYRRYFECFRKLTKRYFSQVGMTKSQLSNMEKMCERGTYLLDNWYNVLNDLIAQKNEVQQESFDETLDNNALQATDRSYNTFSQINSLRNLEQQAIMQVQNEKRLAQNPTDHPTSTIALSQKKNSLNRIREVDDEESDANSPNGSIVKIRDLSPEHNQKLIQEKMERIFEKKQNLKILKQINFHFSEFFKANFLTIQVWVKYGKKTENHSIYSSALFKATQLIDKLELTKDQDLIHCFAKVYIEIGNCYLQQGSMKECVKNYEKGLQFLQKEMLMRSSGENIQKLLKMSVKNRKKEQDKLQDNLLATVCLLYNISIAEEYQENISRVLESLNLAEWLSSIYLNGFSEIQDLIFKANDEAKSKYKVLVIEEGEIHIIMDEALGIREQKRKTNELNQSEKEDFYSYYSQILYDKYNIKELNQSLFITVPKQQNFLNMTTSIVSEINQGNQNGSFTNFPSAINNSQNLPLKVSAFHNSNNNSNIVSNNNIQMAKKNISVNSSSSLNQQGSTMISSNIKSRQFILDETPNKYKIDPQYKTNNPRIREFNSTGSKRNTTLSLIHNTYTPQNQNQNMSMLNLNQSQKQSRASISHSHRTSNQNGLSSINSSPQQQYQFVPFDLQQKLQSENNITKSEILRNVDVTYTPNHKRERVHQVRSMTAIGIVTTPQSIKHSPTKQEARRTTPQPYQPKLLTTSKYFNESNMIYYSQLENKEQLLDKQKTDEEKKQQVRNQLYHQPQIVQNLDYYFRDKINEKFQQQNERKGINLEYEFVQKGINIVMKEENFDKDEFSNAFKLLKLKKQKQKLREGEEAFDKKEPHEIKITTNQFLQNEIDYYEMKQNLKQELTNQKAAQKELENQRLAKNLIKEDDTEDNKINLRQVLVNKKNSVVSLKNVKEALSRNGGSDSKTSHITSIKSKIGLSRVDLEKQQGLTPQQIAKKAINAEIEQIDNKMRSEKKEINELSTPFERRFVNEENLNKGNASPYFTRNNSLQNSPQNKNISQNQSYQHSRQILFVQKRLNKLLNKKYFNQFFQIQQLFLKIRSNSRSRKLKFLDNYQDISKSTQLISVKRDVKKATTFIDLAFGSYKLQKLGMERNKLSSQDGTGSKQPSPASKIAQTLHKSLRKLMKLKTSELQDQKSN